ncbi:DUF2461 domain-containing protein [Bryobacter aggregatus]|uniref:DUF2461 domain-containing protein n=1 Tax=Bryobacter aggregatus TaxID=360054 RepID=UPI0006909934|nr:DUF2461 domain-containing protein [Bryobacter aggregatus]
MPRSTVGFPGFPKEALQFFQGLEKNNNREWFEKKKPVYEEKVKAPMIELVAALNQELLAFAPEHIVEPKKAILRIYRDIRFSKDKTPYKTNIAADFHRHNLGKGEGASFYIHLTTKEFMIAAGVYNPLPEHLKLYRAWIADHHAEFRKIVENQKLKNLMGELQGEVMKRTPKGYLPGHPAEDLLKRKMYIFWTSLPPELAETSALLGEISKRMKALTPFIEFLNRPLLQNRKPIHFNMPK